MARKDIICLANSDMNRGRCIAGKETTGKQEWIRPVSDRLVVKGLSSDDYRYEDGRYAKVLDLMEVVLLDQCTFSHQTENWLIDDRYPWKYKGQGSFHDLAALMDDPPVLWKKDIDFGELTTKILGGIPKINDRVDFDTAQNLSCSLYLIQTKDMVIQVTHPEKKPKVRGKFTYRDIPYDCAVTDPEIKSLYDKKPDGEYPIGECYITVSLAAEPLHKSFYKLIAAIIMPECAMERTK